MMNVPLTLPNLSSRSPFRFRFPGAPLRDRATLPSPLCGLDPSGGYPSRLRSLRSLRGPLARRFASLTAACRYVAVVQCAGIPVQPCPPVTRLPSPAAPALGCASARWRPHSRTPPSLLSRRVSSAQPPRRLPFGSTSGTLPPSFCTLDWTLSTPFGGSALTPDAARCPELEVPVCSAVSGGFAVTSRHEPAGKSECSGAFTEFSYRRAALSASGVPWHLKSPVRYLQVARRMTAYYPVTAF